MEIGTEYSSWQSFLSALEYYSKTNKVLYIIGTCKSVESANKNDSLVAKFPVKFKYCFARMVCNHFGSYKSRSSGARQNQSTCKTGCRSSVLVSVNKSRTALVVKEANLCHTHGTPETVFNKSAQNRGLQGEERRMASVLLRAGVPLVRVQEFIAKACDKYPTNKDRQNTTSGVKSSPENMKALEFEYLSDLDKIMSEDPEAEIEMVNFDLVPGAIYIQTSVMRKRMKALKDGLLQVVPYSVNSEGMSVLSILGIDSDFNTHVLSFCLVVSGAEASFQYFIEAFVRNNPEFCDTLLGIVVDCSKDSVDFVQLMVPQTNIAWSRSHIFEKFTEEIKVSGKDFHKQFQLRKDLMNAQTEDEYDSKLKELLNSNSTSISKEFLRTWDSLKELWVQYEISSVRGLSYQKCAVEMDYTNSLKDYIKSSSTLSDVIKSLFRFEKSSGKGEKEKLSVILNLDPCFEAYRSLCFSEAARAVCSQVTIALNSSYNFKVQTDMIFVKRRDNDDEFILNTAGNKCTCQHFMDSELPCQHVFAFLKHSNKPLYDEALIPEKWQVFGKSLTLDALAESLARGHVPSSAQHDERLRELQTVARDILSECSLHSYEQMGKDWTLLTQVLAVLKDRQSHAAKLVPGDASVDEITPSVQSSEVGSLPVRRRGRPRKVDKVASRSPAKSVSVTSTTVRHNLRTNIKHKFVKREPVFDEAEVSSDVSQEVVNSTIEDAENNCPSSNKINETISSPQNKLPSIVGQTISVTEEEMPLRDMEDKQNSLDPLKPIPDKDLEHSQRSPEHQDPKQGVRCGYSTDTSATGQRPAAVKRSHSEVDESSSESANSSDDGDDEDEDEEVNLEKLKAKRAMKRKEIDLFLEGMSEDVISEVLQVASTADSVEESLKAVGSCQAKKPVDVLIHSCKDSELMDYAAECLKISHPGFDLKSYKAAASVVCRAHGIGTPVQQVLQSLSAWPGHLPRVPSSRPFEEEIALNTDQWLTVCGHKLDKGDLATLQSSRELSSNVIHAYLEVLAQKHNGKMFIIPFDVIHLWRQGSYSDKIFKKVHFKTFEYLVLPIHCGAEFSEAERQGVKLEKPYWMALVADVQNKSVCVLNPRTEDKYSIAANGYMLQWRRYMQIRSVHTGEMLSMWRSRVLDCSKQMEDHTSGLLMLMNVEALVCGVHPAVMTEAHIPGYLHYMAVTLRDMDRETTVLCVGGPECQQLAARDADWLQCENCRTWWHRACAGHSDSQNVFYCTSCQQRIRLTGQSAETMTLEENSESVLEDSGAVVEEGSSDDMKKELVVQVFEEANDNVHNGQEGGYEVSMENGDRDEEEEEEVVDDHVPAVSQV
ncbi:uncharacterized protein LOC101863250 [Aplysia californica]|uniref:Uncharacterized protein LOC101863250 n=1 Tax=Aplysia californica TaxID=6500 RepID=A0ABM1VQF7_APLCA|nr:uncharacterized protein LOC101863250 [Aplysia californica]